MDGPPTSPGYFFDVPNGTVCRGDKAVWTAVDSVRVFELLTVLGVAHHQGRRHAVRALSRALMGSPAPAQIRRWLAQVDAEFVNVDGDGTVALNVGADERVHPDPPVLRRHLARLQGRIGTDPEPRARAARAHERAIAEAELAVARGETAAVLARFVRGPRGGGFLAHVERHSSAVRSRPRLLTAAHTIAAKVSMESAEVRGALRHIAHANRWARAFEGPEATDAQIDLHATRAATERMRAALYPDEAEDALRAAHAAFLAGIAVSQGAVDLPADLRRARLRWVSAEAATPLGIMAGLADDAANVHADEASSHLSEAQDLLGAAADSTEVASTHLMRVREALLAKRLPYAREHLREANVALMRPDAAEWALGWLPRYEADVERAHDPISVGPVREALLRGWRRNRSHLFQRLMLLARFGAWQIEPIGNESVPDRVTLMAEMVALLGTWHANRLGLPPSKCPRCHEFNGRGRGLVQRIRCTFDLDVAARGHLRLGTWR